jgi:hypothetical protein
VNAAFLLGLRASGVRFAAIDLPEANDLTVGIMALVAQAEREAISKRTKSLPWRRNSFFTGVSIARSYATGAAKSCSMNLKAAGRFSSQVGTIWSGGRMKPPSWNVRGLSSIVKEGMAYVP